MNGGPPEPRRTWSTLHRCVGVERMVVDVMHYFWPSCFNCVVSRCGGRFGLQSKLVEGAPPTTLLAGGDPSKGRSCGTVGFDHGSIGEYGFGLKDSRHVHIMVIPDP
ncbi:hypothetical protein Sjap_014435 [Stephania japonica]|uniref:Uncharacterized protein n=1 Tax=Stephania japonica TaxID=461633 RepID=A0AAP0II84_9MAGN